MTTAARILAPARRTYRGGVTDPERWATWTPRPGDVLVCTPPKCGTTWTQTILAMLVHGGPDLPAPVPVISPWIDADLGVPAAEVAAAVEAQSGRRVIKTHTPADGFPIWEGVTVVAVYRHPLDVFFSLRRHVANMTETHPPDRPFLAPLPESFRRFVEGGVDREDFGHDTLAKITLHYRETACSEDRSDLKRFHYTDMRRDGHGAVARLADAIGVRDTALVDRVAKATAFDAMKENAANYTPVAGTGFWKSDADFFDSASSRKWEGRLSEAEVALFRDRLEELVPDARARRWLEDGDGPSA
ncbi:MAG TPA: sulfotransferase domain-containing protein [Paracoccaceae bacterium]|nr:sulfotransferase domain-containing protein [Paracoccaceae bacterium]